VRRRQDSCERFAAVRRLRDAPADHHEVHVLERLHVIERIAGDGDEIRKLARLDGSPWLDEDQWS